MVNFKDDIYGEDGVIQEEAPKVYEPGGTLKEIKVGSPTSDKYNEENPSKDGFGVVRRALKHMIKINRLMEMQRGEGLLVDVDGSVVSWPCHHTSQGSCASDHADEDVQPGVAARGH